MDGQEVPPPVADARYAQWVTCRLERATRDRLMRFQGRQQAAQDRYVSVSDAVEALLDLADRLEAAQLAPEAMADAFAGWLADEDLAVDTAQCALMALAYRAGACRVMS